MKFIGITGGVGAGKSTILAYLRENYRVRTLIADEIAHEIMEPGYDCYEKLQKEFFRERIWLRNGRINRQRLASIIFADEDKRRRLNAIVHPAVKEYILQEVEKERRSQSTDYVILEAALLIEEHYDRICDELWYVYVTEENRRKRLMEDRGYSGEQVEQIFRAQLPDSEFRKYCKVVIDNNGTTAQVHMQLAKLLKEKGEEEQMEQAMAHIAEQTDEPQLVFGLDIGTRNVVGTVGYKKEDEFIVTAQFSMEHETRAMLDGQIHDIGRVGRTIGKVKEKLEEQIGRKLTDVCIAAAGRVLETVTTDVSYEFPEETVVTGEDIHTLDLLGVDHAYQELKERDDTKYKFYCVGYSVMKYYLNDEIFSNLESHKANKISEKIIVTFLPEDVVDGLYMAVGFAGLSVANMTLEPIAAIDVAIPENFRMLNIALVDVGAGTSDISLTRDGSIIAYGMIPLAGDEITETIVQHYLVDFKMAEHIKLSSATEDEDAEIEFEDIMSLKHTIPAREVWELTEPLVDRMTTEVADKIKELNGDQTVSATFIVGGGGKIHGYAQMLAQKLELPQERVALRGEEVLKEVTFLQDEIRKDPLLVTPIGICLNYYEQKNNFIMVHFNGERLKLYDNNKLTIVDAAIQAGFPNDQLFPKRGREIHFTVNGKPRAIRGEAGESAVVMMNDRPASINDPIEPNCYITIEPSTEGEIAHYSVGELEEYHNSTIEFTVNGKRITCPRYVEVNGILEPPTYEIREGDIVETRSFYTVEQLAEFMDVELDPDAEILVNNRVEELNALVYENFQVDWKVLSFRSTEQDVQEEKEKREKEKQESEAQKKEKQEDEAPKKEQQESEAPKEEQRESEALKKEQQESEALKKEQQESKASKEEQQENEVLSRETQKQDQEEEAPEKKSGEKSERVGNVMPEAKEQNPGIEGIGTVTDGSFQDTVHKEEADGKPETVRNIVETAPEKGAEIAAKSSATDTGTTAEKPETGAANFGTETDIAALKPVAEATITAANANNQVDTSVTEAWTAHSAKPELEADSENFATKPEPESDAVVEKPQKSGDNFAEKQGVDTGISTGEPESDAETSHGKTEPGVSAGEKEASSEGAFTVIVNGDPIILKDKKDHVFVEIFDYIDFDLSASRGRMIVTEINGKDAQYTQILQDGDKIDIYWKER